MVDFRERSAGCTSLAIHCTGHRGPCGNTYVREEELVRQFGEILKQ